MPAKAGKEVKYKMRKVVDLLVTLCMLAAAVVFLMLGGRNALTVMSGAKPLEEGTSFKEAEGKYITYEAAYPVGSYEEEFYSGDPDRVKNMGYVLYDEARQAFLYVVTPKGYSYGFDRLLRNRKMPEQSWGQLDLTPVSVDGSLTPMDDSMISHAKKALRDRRTDNEALEAVWDSLAETQKDWYMLEYATMGGMEMMDIWLCALAGIVSLLIFIVRLVKMFTGGKKQAELAGTFDSRFEQFFAMQRGRLQEWGEHMRGRANKSMYLCVLGTTVGLVAIGFLAGYSPEEVLVRHFPIGLLFGEFVCLCCYRMLMKRADWKKILKKTRKNVEKAFPSAGQQDEFAQDYLDSYREWGFEGKGKDSMAYGFLGNKYWAFLSGLGDFTVIDPFSANRVDTYVDMERVAYGKYRGSLITYVAKFFMRDKDGTVYEKNYLFPTKEALDNFAQLLKRHAGDRIEVVEKD